MEGRKEHSESRRKERGQEDTMRGHNREDRTQRQDETLGIMGNTWEILEGDYMVGTWNDIVSGDQGHRYKVS